MAKQQSKPNYSNPNYPPSMSKGGSRAGRNAEAQLTAQVAQRRAEAIARQQAANNQPAGPSNVNYVDWYNKQQAGLPSPGETQSE